MGDPAGDPDAARAGRAAGAAGAGAGRIDQPAFAWLAPPNECGLVVWGSTTGE